MSCPYAQPSPNKLNLGCYEYLHDDGKKLIKSWFDKAASHINCAPEDSFEPFIFSWIAFNGWASCLTDEDHDAEIIRKIGNCPNLRKEFGKLVKQDIRFKADLVRFSELWPVFKALDIRKAGYFRPLSNDRKAVVAEYFNKIPDVQFSPKCARFHKNETPKDWPHTLHTIYRVRCNLFHGEKSPHSEMSAQIVKAAFVVLIGFLDKASLIK